MIKAVIFDVDGTLVDSVDLHTQAWQEALAEFGKEIPYNEVRMQIGKGGDQLLPVFFSEQELERCEEKITKYRSDLFKDKYLDKVVSFPKVRETFQAIEARGLKIALASSAKSEELQTYKKVANVEDLLDEETSADDADKSKPHPDIFEAALGRLGNPDPAECIVVGDTPYDIEAAKKAGIPAIAVRCGGFPEETLAGAIAIYDDLEELLAKLAASPLAASSAR